MRIEIAGHLLDDAEALRHVDVLVDRLEVHDVTTDVLVLAGSLWARSRPGRSGDWKKRLARPVSRGRDGPALHRQAIEVADARQAEAAARQAVSPLVILVEDYEADGRFLDVVVEELGADLALLWAACKSATPAGLRIDSASLGNMPVRIRREVESARTQGRPVRLLVIHDSDRRWPGDEGDLKATGNIARACRDGGAPPPHALRKRTVENYIPDETFRAIRDATRDSKKAAALDALLSLTSTQRDHIPIKLHGKEDELDGSLYDGADRRALADIKQVFKKRPRPIVAVLDTFDERDTFTAETLRARDARGELDALLQRIADAL